MSFFDKLAFIKPDIDEKFCKATVALPTWGDIYQLGDLEFTIKLRRWNESFSRLLDKPVASSRYIAMSLDECSKLESCVSGLVESQSFSFWALATVFAFLKDSTCAPEDDIFHRLLTSLTVALNA